jgi:AhpD family alkylhydroperoxidase
VPTGNIFRVMAHAPILLDAFLSYANAMRDGSELSPKLRELAVLTVGHTAGSEYEVAHHQSHGRKAGITPEQLAAIPEFASSDLFDDVERAVMQLAKEATAKAAVSNSTWSEAAAHLNDKQMVELALNVAWYNSGVRIMGILDIELEESYRQ